VAAQKLRLAGAPVSQSPAPADARIEPPAGLTAAAPGREHAASEPSSPAHRAAPQAPVVQLGIQIAGAASRHVERLVVQLEPAALGRVEVRLDFSHDNRVSALIAADRPETLELLQRDSRALERGLQDAGLRLDQDALSFSLRQEQRGHERGAGPPGLWPRLEPATGPASRADHADDAGPARWIGAHRVLDIRI
jgi:flagellar hook-length control protein FliK